MEEHGFGFGSDYSQATISAKTQAYFFAELVRSGLFSLEPVESIAMLHPDFPTYDTTITVEARIDGRQIRAIATRELTRLLGKFKQAHLER